MKMHIVLRVAAVMTCAMAQMPAHAAPAAAPTVAKHYSVDETPVGTLLADPAAKAIVDKYIPGFSDSPSIGAVSGISLRAVQPMAGDKISDKALTDIDADLAKIPAK